MWAVPSNILGKSSRSVDDLINELKPLGRSNAAGRPAPANRFSSGKRPFRMRPLRPDMGPWAIRGCVTLGAVFGVAMNNWPYDNRCGWGLFFYSLALTLLLLAGTWCLRLTWKGRLGFAHIVALATLLWGTALTAHLIAPRVGYAARAATWYCVN